MRKHDVKWHNGTNPAGAHRCFRMVQESGVHTGPCRCLCGVQLSKVDRFYGDDAGSARTWEHDA